MKNDLKMIIENSQNFQFSKKRTNNKIRVLAIEPSLSLNEFYGIIMQNYILAPEDGIIDFRICRIKSFGSHDELLIAVKDVENTDVIIVPQSLQNMIDYIEASKKINPSIKFVCYVDIIPDIITKKYFKNEFKKHLKKNQINEHFELFRNQIKNNLGPFDAIVCNNKYVFNNLEDKKPKYLLKNIFPSNNILVEVDEEISLRDQFVDNFISVLIEIDEDNFDKSKKIIDFLLKEIKTNITINIIGFFDVKHLPEDIAKKIAVYKPASILYRPKLLKKINADIYIDTTIQNTFNKSQYNECKIYELLNLGYLPIVQKSIDQLFSIELPVYNNNSNLIKKIKQYQKTIEGPETLQLELSKKIKKINSEDVINKEQEQLENFYQTIVKSID